MLERRGGLPVEDRQVALERGAGGALADELEVRGDIHVLLRCLVEDARRALHGLVGERHLAARRDLGLGELADGLAGRGDHAAHAVDLIAEELDTHRRGCLRGEDVDRIAVDVEAAGGVDGAGIGVAHAHEQGAHVLEGHLVAHGEGAAREVAAARRGHAAQQRSGARHHDAALAGGEALDGAAAGGDHGVVGCGARPRVLAALGEAAHVAGSEPGCQRAGGTVGGLLARDDVDAGARAARPEGGEHELARALRDREVRVLSPIEGADQRPELGCREQLVGNAVDEHGRTSLRHDSRPERNPERRKKPPMRAAADSWWAMTDSNRRPCACKAPALATAPIARADWKCTTEPPRSQTHGVYWWA